MIRFQNVRGDVLVDDRRTADRVMARDGLTLKPDGDYLVITTQNSSADVHAVGKLTNLAPFSYLRLAPPNRFVVGKHAEYWVPQQTKAFLARLWALAGGR